MGDPVRDPALEGLVPEAWRPTLRAIVESLVRRDPIIGADLPSVDPVSTETSQRCLQAIDDYGDVMLVSLPDDTWRTSVALSSGHHWHCLIDLWSREEGRTDLVLDLDVYESAAGYRFHVHLVYVP